MSFGIALRAITVFKRTGETILKNRTARQRVLAATAAVAGTGAIISTFVQSEDQETSTASNEKRDNTPTSTGKFEILKFPLDIESSAVPYVLIKVYETQTGAVDDNSSFVSGFKRGIDIADNLNVGTVVGGLIGASTALTPAALALLKRGPGAAATILGSGAIIGAGLVGSGAVSDAAGGAVNLLAGQVGISDATKRYKDAISNFALKRNTVQFKVAIALLMPENLAVSYQNNYDQLSFTSESGSVGLLAQALGSKLGGSGDAANPYLIEAAGKAVESAGLITEGFKRIGLFATTGRTVNPQPEMIYNSPTLREFNMDYRLVPRNQLEAIQIYNIIKVIKEFASPQILDNTGGRYFIPPAQFELEFYTPENKTNNFLFKTKKCVLQDIAVDYTGSGSFTTFSDGAPTEIRLSLKFQETVFIDQKAVREGF